VSLFGARRHPRTAALRVEGYLPGSTGRPAVDDPAAAARGRGDGIDNELVSVAPDGFEAQADWTNLRSPETYLGYSQGQNLDSPDGVAYDEPRSYVAPESLQLNTWALAGNWTIEGGRAC